MSMSENIYFGKDSSTNTDRVKQLIKITDIKKIMEKFPHECSEATRVAADHWPSTPKLFDG